MKEALSIPSHVDELHPLYRLIERAIPMRKKRGKRQALA